MTEVKALTKRELISALIDSVDGDGSLDDVVYVRNLNDDRSDEDEIPLGQYGHVELDDEDGYFQIGFYGPSMDNNSMEEDVEEMADSLGIKD